jgi:hypothetical protein
MDRWLAAVVVVSIAAGVACGMLLALPGCMSWLPARSPAADACEAACARLEALGCDAARLGPSGSTCEAACELVELSGRATLHPACVALATSCEEADRVSLDGCE